MAFTPSKYQVAIINEVKSGTGDIVVEAVAGSGKTTTLVKILEELSAFKTAMFAFNKHIAVEIGRKAETAGRAVAAQKGEMYVNRLNVSTIHAYGYKTVANAVYGQSKGKVKKLNLVDLKYNKLAEEFINMTISADERQRSFLDAKFAAILKVRVNALVELVRFVRSTLTNATDESALDALMSRYDITLDPKDSEGEEHVKKGVLPLIRKGIELYRTKGIIDFTDMIFLPYAINLVPEKFDRILVDEAQDLNAAQRWLVLAGRAQGGRMIFVGDSKQAIMGFAGADTASFFKIIQETNAVTMPLSICYRSPERHLNMARLLVPQIEARENAPKGEVNAIHDMNAVTEISAAYKTAQDGVLVLSRTTAPLVGLCIRLIKGRIAARVRGRDIAKGLIDVAQAAGKLAPDFLDGLELYESKQLEKLMKKEGNESRIDMLKDKCEALRICYTEFTVDTVEALCVSINNIFSDEKPAVWLSTIHRAKGLEAEVVFILNPKKLPFSHPKQTPEDVVQEYNLLYVALTRSTDTLTFIHPDGDELPKPGQDVENLSLAV